MGTPRPMSACRCCFRPVVVVALLLLLLTCSRCPVLASPTSTGALPSLGELGYHYSSIFSPLLKALSEHAGPGWSPGNKRRVKPGHRYIKYLTEVYKKSTSRQHRSVDGAEVYNMLRLIRPQDKCLALGNKERCMHDLSYSLNQVRSKEQLLKSTLLYSFDRQTTTPTTSFCSLSVKEQERSNQCRPCPVIHHTVNLTADGRKNWVEVDVTSFVQPLLKSNKKNVHLLINIACSEESSVQGDGRRSLSEFALTPPPLLLYLNNKSNIKHQKSLFEDEAGDRPNDTADTFHEQVVLKPEQRFGRKKRWKRQSLKSKRGAKNLDIQLPESLPGSVSQTSHCALYDFWVRFSRLNLDHWIAYPPKYNPRYCRGSCPRTVDFLSRSPLHTMVQNIIYEELDHSVPQPSCIPSHYSPLSVMMFEEDGSYLYKNLEDMVATSCTCR